MDYRHFQNERYLRHLVSTPFIWAPLVAVVFLDVMVSLYQAVCFPLYRLQKVKRSDYIQIMDRSRLEYLSGLEKLDCMYCGYVNGFLLYAKEISGRTEKYWCGIMHSSKPGFVVSEEHKQRKFARYGDAQEFYKKYGINDGK